MKPDRLDIRARTVVRAELFVGGKDNLCRDADIPVPPQLNENLDTIQVYSWRKRNHGRHGRKNLAKTLIAKPLPVFVIPQYP